MHVQHNEGRIIKSDPIQAFGADRAQIPVTVTSGRRQGTRDRSSGDHSRRMLDQLRKPFDTGVRKIRTSARKFGKSVFKHKGKLGA